MSLGAKIFKFVRICSIIGAFGASGLGAYVGNWSAAIFFFLIASLAVFFWPFVYPRAR